ncbi:MAG: PD-(D/E)XK nuclease family protein, partial [Pseudomonadota bacterium]
MASDIWDAVSSGVCPEHPMAPFVPLLSALDRRPDDIEPWSDAGPAPARHRLITQAMRPAPVTDAWQREADILGPAVEPATRALSLLEAQTPRHEAAAIALATRHALEVPGKSVLILTGSAGLARRINAELARFGIEADDSLGRPLALTPTGVFLRLIAEIAEGAGGALKLAALLSHPLCRPGCSRPEHEARARRYEQSVLRRRDVSEDGSFPEWPSPEPDDADWLDRIATAVHSMRSAILSGADLRAIVSAHIEAATLLSCDTGPEGVVWDGDDGEAARQLFTTLRDASDAYGPDAVEAYAGLVTTLMRSEEVRMPGQAPHPRVTLMSPRESRVASADLVILAGLNEGGWPGIPSSDPWLSRPMRASLGLPPLERSIGLAAHDFQQSVMAPEVILSRSLKDEGTPTVPSRWLTRIEILLDGLDRLAGGEPQSADAMRERGNALLRRLGHIHRPDGALIQSLPRAVRPEPKPPVAARPRRLSVTTIETLIRDPYAVYARRILKLLPSDPLGASLDLRDRGTLIHRILELFTNATRSGLPDDAEDYLTGIADDVLSDTVRSPSLRRIWRARVGRFAPWFVEGEVRRRANGVPGPTEVKGQMILPEAGGTTISAIADRIDLLWTGEAAIFDYKAGEPPTSRQIDAGFNHQLHLQAAILSAGGFEGVAAAAARTGSYIGLTGSLAGGKETVRTDLADEVAVHLDRVRQLVGSYDLEQTP